MHTLVKVQRLCMKVSNYNAGTEGPNMVEGRISAESSSKKFRFREECSSTMGTLSGGNKEIITVGENCPFGCQFRHWDFIGR